MKVAKLLTAVLLMSQVMAQTAMSSEKIERKLFTLEKSLNSENILLIHTQTDENCKFVENQNGYVDFYWLMDGNTKKEVHPMIRSKVADRVKFSGINDDKNSFQVKLNDLSELKTDLEDNKITVQSAIVNGACQIQSVIKLGATAKYKKLNLKRTYCSVEKNFLGVPKGCKYLDLEGTDVDTNEALKVRFMGK
ncbi:MAG: DUF4833 domain-containing protein [Rhizobacter sp.]|nr:DUF4833 domain-containing protein [Bacteriovorax sp.]